MKAPGLWQKLARPKIRPLAWTGADDARPSCGVRGCAERARYVIAFRVVMGRRESERKEFRCLAHGRTYAEHKGLTLPAA